MATVQANMGFPTKVQGPASTPLAPHQPPTLQQEVLEASAASLLEMTTIKECRQKHTDITILAWGLLTPTTLLTTATMG
jgi:hypothetical protein